MRRGRLCALSALCALVVAGMATGVAPATVSPSGTQSLLGTPTPTTVAACGGTVDARVTITGHAATSGQATDVMLVLDLSGSIVGSAAYFQDLRDAANAALDALDAADGAVDGSTASNLNGATPNKVGIITYRDNAASVAAGLTTDVSSLHGIVNGPLTPNGGGSPHAAAINQAATTLAGSTTKAMVIITDGLGDSATTAAANARAGGVRIVPVGIGTATATETNLKNWAGPGNESYYQSGSPATGTIDGQKLRGDLGALFVDPADFSVAVALGTKFSATPLTNSAGTGVTPALNVATPDAGTLTWTGTFASPTDQTFTLDYKAKRNNDDVFNVTNEVVNSVTASVDGNPVPITPPALAIDVLPCGGTPVAPPTQCTGSPCTASGTAQDGTKYTLDAGSPQIPTTAFLTGLNTTPPDGACPGFQPSTSGVQFDIRPLTTDATFQIVIPKAALGSKKWWQTDVCLGTNLKFTTAIGSIANLRPGAKLIGGGTLPGRYFGLLPSISRLTLIQGLGWVWGPWITSRSQDSSGNAIIKIKVPYVAGSAGFTTDSKPGYDPKTW